jgi:hypothetical protein
MHDQSTIPQHDFLTPFAGTDNPADPRRMEPRPRTLLAGKLVFGPQELTADCSIRNLTAHGAKIQTTVAANLTPDIWLIIVRRGAAYRCSLAWRRGEEVGLKFISEHDLATDTDPRTKIARYVWRQLTDR